MKSLSSLIVAVALITGSATSFAAYPQRPVTTAEAENAQERLLTEDGSERTSSSRRIAEGGAEPLAERGRNA